MNTSDTMFEQILEDICFRNLKIQPVIRVNRWSTSTVPEIRLIGGWLEKLGFHPGDHVRIECLEKKLIISVEE